MFKSFYSANIVLHYSMFNLSKIPIHPLKIFIDLKDNTAPFCKTDYLYSSATTCT